MRTVVAVLSVLLAPILAAGALGPATPAWATEPLPAAPREFVLVMQGVGFNGRVWPDTPFLEAFVGDPVAFTVLVPPAVAEPHTFHVHGHTWTDPDTGARIDTKLLRTGEWTRFEVVAGGEDLQAGDWLYHCHVDSHLAAGMSGLFRVHPFSLAVEEAPASPAREIVLHVRAARLGAPVALDSLVVERADGVALPLDWREVAAGAYEVRLPRSVAPSSDGLVVTAASPLGDSVARLPGAPAAPAAPASARALPAAHAPGVPHVLG